MPPVKAAKQPSQTGKGKLSPAAAATMGVNIADKRMRKVPREVVVFSKPIMVLQLAIKAQRPISSPAAETLDPVVLRNQLTKDDEEAESAADAASVCCSCVCRSSSEGCCRRVLTKSIKTKHNAAAVVCTAATIEGTGACPSPCRNRYLVAGALVPHNTALQTSAFRSK